VDVGAGFQTGQQHASGPAAQLEHGAARLLRALDVERDVDAVPGVDDVVPLGIDGVLEIVRFHYAARRCRPFQIQYTGNPISAMSTPSPARGTKASRAPASPPRPGTWSGVLDVKSL